MWAERLRTSSLVTLAALIPHYAASFLFRQPLLTDAIAEWIMARTPNQFALAIMDSLGTWAKPAAATGGLAALGFAVLLGCSIRWWVTILIAAAYSFFLGVTGWTFWIPAVAAIFGLQYRRPAATQPLNAGRRTALVQIAGVAAVAIESRFRDERLARTAVAPVDLFPSPPLHERASFAPGLVRSIITPTAEFYGMSKNTVDPTVDPRQWRLKVTIDGKPIREFSYAQLLNVPRTERYVAMRCISNTLKSNLMGCAHWSGIPLRSLIDSDRISDSIREIAVIGLDGHGDSLPLDYAFSDGSMFALGMNGKTLDRTHGFPIRLLAPKYYGLKSIKWISELRLVTQPFYGTWPKLGYTREPLVHIACSIDKMRRTGGFCEAGGVAMAGDRGIQKVRVRLDQGQWVDATLEPVLSPLTWTRWSVRIPLQGSANPKQIEAQAQDGTGAWQESEESALFPDGVKGPTIRRVSL